MKKYIAMLGLATLLTGCEQGRNEADEPAGSEADKTTAPYRPGAGGMGGDRDASGTNTNDPIHRK